MDVTTRERTHTWSDPRTLAAAATDRDGLAFLRAMADGTLPPPPIMTLVGAGVESVEPGRVVFTVEPAEYHYNPIGSVHGGIYATLLDSATGCAVHSTLPAGVAYTSLDLSVKFLRRLTADSGTSRATASSSTSAGSSPPDSTKSPRLIWCVTWASMKRWSTPS